MVKEAAGETGEVTGKAGKATGKVIGDRRKEEAEGTAKRLEDEIKKRRSTEDRPLPDEPPD
ncbi:hypothetical protein ACWD7C_01030 [Streptomyces sp. NPDC005134]|uniref:hypothetical protein n=1 Tax=Streptomyces sp. NPDC005098 TaxID=3154560 RepID=UPI0033B3A3CC